DVQQDDDDGDPRALHDRAEDEEDAEDGGREEDERQQDEVERARAAPHETLLAHLATRLVDYPRDLTSLASPERRAPLQEEHVGGVRGVWNLDADVAQRAKVPRSLPWFQVPRPKRGEKAALAGRHRSLVEHLDG